MSIKRSQLLKEIEDLLPEEFSAATGVPRNESSEVILSFVEKYLEPRVRPLTEAEVDDHVLVKQVHHSRKDEVRNYVRNLDYEWKKEYLPEDE
jgi:hypothetical protein